MPRAGAKKSSFGSTPTVLEPKIRARAVTLSDFAAASDATITAAAPSEIWLAFAAVTVPSGLNAGFNFARVSAELSARKPSSTSSPVFCLICSAVSATISLRNHPCVVAWAART